MARRRRIAAKKIRPGMILGDLKQNKARWEVVKVEDGRVHTRIICWHDGSLYDPSKAVEMGREYENFPLTDPWFEDPHYFADKTRAQLQDHADYYAAVTEGVGDV